MIKVDSISKSYGNNHVLKNINIQFESGKVYGIVGVNGSGKTTLFRCLAGLETFHGNIQSSFKQLKNHIGLLETNPLFISKLTGWEYLKLVSIARGIEEENFEERNIFDLPLGSYASEYSTGMKKKLALMGILLQKNEIYILDEPFNGVDFQNNILIEEIIKKLRDDGKIVLIASHIFRTLESVCDEIVLLSDGTFVEHVYPHQFREFEDKMKQNLITTNIERLQF